MNDAERHKSGAHYTAHDDIMRVRWPDDCRTDHARRYAPTPEWRRNAPPGHVGTGDRPGRNTHFTRIARVPTLDRVEAGRILSYNEAVEQFDRGYYSRLYVAAQDNVSEMVRRSGKDRKTVQVRLIKLGIKRLRGGDE